MGFFGIGNKQKVEESATPNTQASNESDAYKIGDLSNGEQQGLSEEQYRQQMYDLQLAQATLNNPDLQFELDRKNTSEEDIIKEYGLPVVDPISKQVTGFLPTEMQQRIAKPYEEKIADLQKQIQQQQTQVAGMQFEQTDLHDLTHYLSENMPEIAASRDVNVKELVSYLGLPQTERFFQAADQVRNQPNPDLGKAAALEKQGILYAVEMMDLNKKLNPNNILSDGTSPAPGGAKKYDAKGDLITEAVEMGGKPDLIIYTYDDYNYEKDGTRESDSLMEQLNNAMATQRARQQATGVRDIIEHCHVRDVQRVANNFRGKYGNVKTVKVS
jgi:hypothetical protein